jgi:cell fate regulator YaaT (PSP1 superfamily)
MTQELIVDEDKYPPTEKIDSEDESSEDSDQTSDDKKAREESRFKEGQILRFVRVRFPGNSRSFPFLVGKRRIEYGQKVVAMSDRGMAVGYVNSFPYEVAFNKSMLPVRSISKVAHTDDFERDREAYRQQKLAENACTELIERFRLDMQLTHVEFTSFGKKAIFYFIAPSRVDFRDLVKDLVGKLKTRIELRQISVRDRSASIGGIGPCGRELCCSSFLTKYGNVGIKMAKNQDLTLNFSKLNGVCGQLKCCLQYEDDVYREKRSRLPREGDIVTTHTGETGRVDRIHLLSEQFDMMTTKGIRKRYVVDLYKETLNKETANFPKEFESVSDETHKIIGMDDAEARKIKAFEAEVKSYKDKSKSFADSVFKDLFGDTTLDYALPEVAELESGRSRVKSFEEEEEIVYTPTEDELLPDDEEDDLVDNEPVTTQIEVIDQRQNREAREQRPRERQDQRVRGPRGDSRSPNPEARQDNRGRDGRSNQSGRGDSRNQNGGPRTDGGPRPEGSRPEGSRSEGQRSGGRDGNRQGRSGGGGQRSQGGGQGQNQGRNRPPRS